MTADRLNEPLPTGRAHQRRDSVNRRAARKLHRNELAAAAQTFMTAANRLVDATIGLQRFGVGSSAFQTAVETHAVLSAQYNEAHEALATVLRVRPSKA